MTHDIFIPNTTAYIIAKIGIVLLALLLWFAVTAAPVI
jgi:hypothetical protein